MRITRVYPKEYKLEAVRIYVESGKGYLQSYLTPTFLNCITYQHTPPLHFVILIRNREG